MGIWINQALASYEEAPLPAFDLVQKALLRSIDLGYDKGQADSYYTLALINLSVKQNNLATEYAGRALTYYKRIKDQAGAFKADWLKARVVVSQELWSQATRLYNALLDDYELGEIYLKAGDEDAAEAQFEAVLRQETDKANKRGQSAAYRNIGRALEQKEQDDEALGYYQQSLDVAEEDEYIEEQLITNNEIADLYGKQGNLEAELDVREQNLAISNTLVSPDGAVLIATTNGDGSVTKPVDANTLTAEDSAEIRKADQFLRGQYEAISKLNIGSEDAGLASSSTTNTLNPIPNPDKSKLQIADLYRKLRGENEAIGLYREAASSAMEHGDLNTAGEAYRNLSDVYTQLGQLDLAKVSFTQFMTLKDSVLRQQEEQMQASLNLTRNLNEQQQKIALLQKDIELCQRRMEIVEQENALQEVNLNRQRLVIMSLVFVIIMAAGVMYFFWKSARQKRLANQLLALRSLRSQMNPHFIFNALNSVNNYIARNDERAANRYLGDFSKLMRAVLENSRHDLVSLASEVRIISLYLDLEHTRFKEKYDYTFEVDPGIDLHEIEVPPMLIQPYIENAIWHGLRYLEHKGHLSVIISPEESGDLLVLIKDTGIGRKKSAELKTARQKETKSTGMHNTASRMQIINQMYGTRLKIQVTDLDPTAEDAGTQVEIHIPQLQEQDLHST